MNKKALIAMSGGVDSSVAAYLMKMKNYDCIGVTMKLYHNEDIGISSKKTCCCLDDVEDAKNVAFKLGFPHYTFNFSDDFKSKVIDRFITSYENGMTPNPCIDCNRYLKFDALYKRAGILGCDTIVTGHYARIEYQDGRYLLKKAVDETKDQSYVLYSMTQQQLAHTAFPCGEMNKTDIRHIAGEQCFFNADKPDSQDICFVPDGDYKRFIRQYTGKDYPGGSFTDSCGNVIGQHKGIINYTVGQHKGIGIPSDTPLYVSRIDSRNNIIVLGDNNDLLSRELDAHGLNWIASDTPMKNFRAKAKIRYRHKEQWADITLTGKDTVHIVFDEPQRAITSGQAVVLYDNDIVLGGGIIS